MSVAEVPCGPGGGGMAGAGVGPGAVLPQQSRDGGGEGDDPGLLASSGDVVEAGE